MKAGFKKKTKRKNPAELKVVYNSVLMAEG